LLGSCNIAEKNKMRNSLVILVLFAVTTFSYSQNYKTAIGIKGGYPGYGSLNGKHFLNSKTAIEGSIGGGTNTLWLQGLYELNFSLEQGLNWYAGGGANLGFYSFKNTITNERTSNMILGLNGIVGIEYTFEDFPLNVALDTGPNLRIINSFGFGWGAGIAVRYAIK
jgi:hypothetical protein